MTDVLIIGCGYLGRRAAARWLAEGRTVSALTRSAARAEELESLGIRPILGEIMRPPLDLPRVETCLYAVGFDRQSGNTRREVACGGLTNVLSALQGRISRLIFISSTSVYGQSAGEWVDEDSPCEPIRENGQVAVEAEKLARGADSPAVTVLRLSGIYGPGRLLQRIEALHQGEPLSGQPDAWLNLIHVEDAARAILAAESLPAGRETLLVSDDRPLLRREYYSQLAKFVGANPPTFSDSAPAENRLPPEGLNKRCRNARMKQSLRLALEFPTAADGLPHAIRG